MKTSNVKTSNGSERRSFLKWGIGSASGLVLLPAAARAWAGACVRTPAQTSGPFYPGDDKFTLDTDLTRIPGKPGRAQGQVVWVKGQVLDSQCRPIAGANVELWQASASGRYQHARDPNPAPLDPNFRYWAETFTDQNGSYAFKTIIPGAYPASADWTRPPHLHFRISALGYKELVTQMYFKGEALNEGDLVLRAIPQIERESVIVEFRPVGPEHEMGELEGEFKITLQSVRA
jgi:protocatechuate 3,4-dioxygenase beta subunit